jgi:predicted permease
MALFRRIGNLFHRNRLDREIDAELQAHIAMRVDDNVARGMSSEAARRDALLRFGNATSTRERVNEADTTLGLDRLLFDVRYAWRKLIKSPGFFVTAIVTLAVAIGANAVVFSVLNALVLRPLDLPGATRLYMIDARDETLNSYPDYLDLRDRTRNFDGMALYTMAKVGLDRGGDAEPLWIDETTGNYFDVLGVKPLLGSFFHASDDRGPNSNPYVVLSYSLWQTHFRGDASVVGRKISLNHHNFTIAGVSQPNLRGTELVYAPQLWAPLVDETQLQIASDLQDRTGRSFWTIGRLKPQVTVAQAEADLDAVAGYLTKTYLHEDDRMKFTLVRPGLLGNMLGPPVRAFVAGLMLLAGLILLAACANLGSLFAARTADRSREVALRLALGSTRRRILRQLLVEAMMVSTIGGAVGLACAVVLLRGLGHWQPVPYFPINVPVSPDVSTYLVAVGLVVLSGLVCGLMPVRLIFAEVPLDVVKTGARATAGGRRFSMRDALLVFQIAACAVLMTSSLVAVRGLERSLRASYGFDPQNRVVVNSDVTMLGTSADQIPAVQRRMVDAAAATPGVTAAGMVSNVPLGLGWEETWAYHDGMMEFLPSKAVASVMRYSMSPDYLRGAGTSLLAGRDFTWRDDAHSPLVAIINAELARKMFGSVGKAMGGHFAIDAKTRLEVVGVVEDGKYMTLTEEQRGVFFQPLQQYPSSETWLVAKAAGDPGQLVPALREKLRGVAPGLPLTATTWQENLVSALFAARAATISLGVLGILGAMLAVTGIFGMASYSVSKRLKEMGIRIALGAHHGQILGAALGPALRLLAIGSVAGLVLGLAATRLLSYIVYDATPGDPLVLAGTIVSMLFFGLVATWAPAQRALSVDPSKLLRED